MNDSIIDISNPEFQKALDLALHTDRSFFLTGKAGTGKTTLLKYILQNTTKETVVLAPTGVAAINAGGQTIHSFFQIAPSIYTPEDPRLSTEISYDETEDDDDDDRTSIYENFKYSAEKLEIIRRMETLIIDEVSMVRADLFDVMDILLREFRDSSLPFGGVQLILVGDLFQLPPVVTRNEADILYRRYQSEFFFSADVMLYLYLDYVELKKVYRQEDSTFIELLNRVRVNRMLPEDFRLFRSLTHPSFRPNGKDNCIILATTNAVVSNLNSKRMAEIPSEERCYDAKIEGEFNSRDIIAEEHLKLKVGAQVMYLKNDSDGRYFNGKIGQISRMDDELIWVSTDYDDDLPEDIAVSREEWKNVRYRWNSEKECVEEEVIGTFSQFPLKLAWAITVHKSQGLTFERVVADLGNSFTAGQVYVALSRCTSLKNLVFTSLITPNCIKVDRRVQDFITYLESRK